MSVRFVIDSLDYARNAGVHHGKIPLAELLRLQDLLFDSNGELIYQVNGYIDDNKKPRLHIEIKGEIQLSCQRCLGSLVHTLELQNSLLLAQSKTELEQADEDDTIDAILATSALDVVDLIEEEIILSLPISSRHPDNECKISGLEINVEKNETEESPVKHPFAALAALRKTK